MNVVINHDHCAHADAFATRCLATMVQNPLGQAHYCMAEVVEDGQPELAVEKLARGEPL